MSLESYTANDLREVFARDMPAQSRIGQKLYTVLLDDLVFEEIDTSITKTSLLNLHHPSLLLLLYFLSILMQLYHQQKI